MTWTKKNYPNSMKNLDTKVRTKAISIANALVEDEGMEESKAIPIAIKKSKSWAEHQDN